MFVVSGTAPVTPFMSTYAKQLGFSSFVVGIIYTVLPAAGMVAKPLMGGIADRFQCQKMIFLMGILVTAVAIVGINFLPSVPQHRRIHFSCDNMEAVLDTCVDGQPTNTNGDRTCALNLLTDEIGQNAPVSCDVSIE